MFSKGREGEVEGVQGTRNRSGVPSVISTGLHVTGDLVSEGDVQVDGAIEGDVKGRSVTVGATGAVKGQIVAEQVLVSGSAHGTIRARSVTIGKTAKVSGDIVHDLLAVEPGARIEGALKRLSSDSLEGRRTDMKPQVVAERAVAS